MRVKLFVANGLDGILAVENDINQWLAAQSADFVLRHQTTAACTVSDDGDSDRYQSVVWTIWYDGGAA